MTKGTTGGSRCRHMLALSLTLTLAIAFIPAPPASSTPGDPLLAEVWVSPTGSDATGTGSRSLPVRSIRRALGLADDDATINVLPGTYDASSGETFPLTLAPAMKLLGIGPGRPRIIGSEWGTILTVRGPVGCVISGLDISGGGAVNVDDSGNGIYALLDNPGDNVEIRNCYIHDNAAGMLEGGGGIEIIGPIAGGGEATITDCLIEGNRAGAHGGGVHLRRGMSSVMIERVRIRNNHAFKNGLSWYQGGGLWVGDTTSLVIKDSEITGNRADRDAGGIYLYNTNAVLYNVLVTNNVAAEPPSAVMVDGGSVHFHGCTIADNYLSPADPAAVYAVECGGAGTRSFHSTIVWGNRPAAVGGVGVIYDQVCTDDPDLLGPAIIDEDPLFINPSDEGPDYHIGRNSPCVDAGCTCLKPPFDLDQRPRVTDGDGDGAAIADIGAYETDSSTRRLSGDDRYETAVEVWTVPEIMSLADEPAQGTNSAVITVGSNFPDALSASALAGAVDGVLLLTKTDSLPDGMASYLRSIGVSGVYLVGGTTVIAPNVQTELVAEGFNVVRIAGADRYETAAAVAIEVKSALGQRFKGQCLVTRGDTFPDALAASPWAYAQGAPVLLTRPDSLPASTASAIEQCGTAGVFVIGGTAAVSPAVATAIDAIPGIGAPRRISGDDRYATAAEVARAVTGIGPSGLDIPVLGWHEVGLATGLNFPDALAGGAACGARGGVLLLTLPDTLAPATKTALEEAR
ncbi:MAG TPA: cell wall-binding repeat-containing protein, partial [Coriobacteriia bacterium]|nr:cell wall-binding repeat-containing protein [Coriobacteriia bacterium]